MRLNQTNSSKSSSGKTAQQNIHHQLNKTNSISRNRDLSSQSSTSTSSSATTASKSKVSQQSATATNKVLNPQNIGSVPRNPLQLSYQQASASPAPATLTPSPHDVHVMTEQSRKVLEEIHKARNLLKQQPSPNPSGFSAAPPGSTPSGIHFISLQAPVPGGPTTISPQNPNSVILPNPNSPVIIGNPTEISNIGLSPAHRAALQTLQQANSTSFGSYISTDSHFGNNILPVLPRLVNNNNINPNSSSLLGNNSSKSSSDKI